MAFKILIKPIVWFGLIWKKPSPGTKMKARVWGNGFLRVLRKPKKVLQPTQQPILMLPHLLKECCLKISLINYFIQLPKIQSTLLVLPMQKEAMRLSEEN